MSQPIVTINYGDVNFLNASKIHKTGTLGETAGSKTLYTNVITSGGQAVDCIVTTVSITNGYFLLPVNPCPGNIPFDYKDFGNCPTGTFTGNQDRFFSPMMYFNNGGGNVKFKFEFIVGGSYNNATHTGQPVILRNVMVNSYDIDGTTGCHIPDPGRNQFNDFSGFNAAARSTPGSQIAPTFNSATGYTRFMSTSNCNIHNVTDPNTRIRVEYDYIQEFEVVMGMTGPGNAFYMLDFGPGPIWTPQYLNAPVLDLNPATDSYNNSGSFCTVPIKLFSGSSNITGSTNSINEFFISVASSDVLDGDNEYLTTDLTNNSHHVRLGAPFSGNQTFTLAGIGFRVDKSEGGGQRTIRYTKSNGTVMTVAEAQTLMSALTYFNTFNTPGIRRFKLWFREGLTTSTFSYFELYGGCMILKARAMDFNAVRENDNVRIDWRVEDIQDIVGYSLERSGDGTTWMEVGRFTVEKNAGSFVMRHIDRPPTGGVLQYRLVERYSDGRFGHSPVKTVNLGTSRGGANPYPNPVTHGMLNVALDKDGIVSVYDASMRKVIHRSLKAGSHIIDLGTLPKGVYILKAIGRSHRILIQ